MGRNAIRLPLGFLVGLLVLGYGAAAGAQEMSLSKDADKRVAAVGEVVTYTLRLKNNQSDRSDLSIVDLAPRGFRYVDGSARVETISAQGLVRPFGQIGTPDGSATRSGMFGFGPYRVPAGSTLKIRYQMVLGSDVKLGKKKNRARAYLDGNIPVSNQASAVVRVVPDSVLEQALVFGKVFCDRDEDGMQNDERDRGIPGARVYIDTGWFAESDSTGKYHLKGVSPGLHLLKIDENTLPPGSEVLGAEARARHLTSGLPAKVNFPVRCAQRVLSAESTEWILGEQTAWVSGDVDNFRLDFQERPVDLPVAKIWVGREPTVEIKSFALTEERLASPVVFGIQAPKEPQVARWSLQVLGPDGRFLDEFSGRGAPGGSVTWEAGERMMVSGTYQAWFHATLVNGTKVTAPPAAFGLGIPGGRVDVPIYPARLLVNGADMPLDEATFGYWVPVLEDDTVEVEFTRANGRRITSRLQFIQPPGPLQVAIRANLDENLVEVAGKPVPVPLGDLGLTLAGAAGLFLGDEGLEKPLVLAVKGDASAVDAWKVVIADPSGKPVHIIKAHGPPPKKIVFAGRTTSSGRGLQVGWYRCRLTAEQLGGGRIRTPALQFSISQREWTEEWSADEMFYERSARPTAQLLEQIHQLAEMIQAGDLNEFRIEVHTDREGGPDAAMQRTRAQALALTSLLLAREISKEKFQVEARGASQLKVEDADPKYGPINRRLLIVKKGRGRLPKKPVIPAPAVLLLDGKPAAAETQIERKPGETLQLEWGGADGRRTFVDVALPGPAPAPLSQPLEKSPVHLQVALPLEGVKVRSEHLWIHGTTEAGNRVRANGQEVLADRLGRFLVRVPLTGETQEVVVAAENRDGQEAVVRAPIRVARQVFFLMGLAEGLAAEIEAGRHLDGVNPRTSTTLEDRLLLHGRTVLYFKARIQGKHLFDQYKITAHLDTAKGDDEDFFSQVVDPERYYPVYGDSGEEVQDVQARRKLYVLIEADQSKLLVGSFRTRMAGLDVLRYDRTFYGGQLTLKKTLGGDFDTEVKAHLTDGTDRARHGHIELTPTGGSLYYLPHSFIIEGSEQVRLVIRDRETGMVLTRIPKRRDVDYTIRYRQGRIIFKSPVASQVEAGVLSMSSHSGLPADGNPVGIEVDYEYEGSAAPEEISWAVSAHETWRDTLRLGGTYIEEQRTGDKFTLWGADLTLRDPDHRQTYLKAEIARSAGSDAENFHSSDGGLSFTSLGVGRPGDHQRPDSGYALKIAAAAELGRYLGYKRPVFNTSGYFQWLEAGFFSPGTLTEQGQTKFGGRLTWHMTKDAALDLRHDGAYSTLYLAGAQRELKRQVSRLGYAHSFGRLRLSGEYLHLMYQDDILPENSEWAHSHALGAGAGYRFSKSWEAFARQEAILRGTVQNFGDRMKTTVGINYKITDDLELTLAEGMRWSGENYTVLGFATALSDKARFYVNERFNLTGGRYLSTTVMGAEDEPFSGVRTYGEYQIHGVSSGSSNRAVLGLNNHFNWGKGWSADLHYERTQVFGPGGFGPGMELSDGTGSAMLPDSVFGGTGFEGVPATAAPGMNGYGSFLAGDSSRDAVGAALMFTGLDNLKLSVKVELRYDDADDDIITNAGLVSTPRQGVKDRLQLLSMAALAWKWTEDLSFHLRLNFAQTQALETSRNGVVYVEEGTEARLLEGSAGFAFRPVRYDWIALLGKYTLLLDRRPVELLAGVSQESENHVFTVMPVIEITALRLQLVEKFALKYIRSTTSGLPDASGHLLLWINRLNFHLVRNLDVGGEYRILKSTLANELKSGFLVEVAYVLLEKIRIGAGYNFTSFSDNEFARQDYNHGGFFLRVAGQY